MPRVPIWRRYLRFFGSDIPADVGDELGFHLESKIDELVAQGWAAEEARLEAHRQFGDLGAIRETCEAAAQRQETHMKHANRFAALFLDVKYGVIQLRHSPGTTLLALIALGIGIGAVTAVFGIVYAVVLRPLPFPAAEQLVSVWSERGGIDDEVTPRNFDAWRREAHSFRQLGAIEPTTFTLSEAGDPVQVPGAFASAVFLQVWGVSPELGRTFTPEEDRQPRLHLVVLSHRLWRDRFASDRGILGTEIHLNREPYTVIGVMPASFSVRPGSEQAWVPLALSGQEMNWTGGILHVVGRLRPGVTVQQAQAEMNVLARDLATRYPEMNRGRGIRVEDYGSTVAGDFKSRLFLLLAAVGLVLLIACGNVANLLLARSAGRAQELAVRAALGASRFRIMRQLLTESMLAGLAGAGLGLALAQLLITIARRLGHDAMPRLDQAGIDGAVFCFAVGLGLASTLLAGLLPALRAAPVDIQKVLRQGGRSATGLAPDRARSVYIAFEVALALVLLVTAGLLIRSAAAAAHTQLGFSAKHVVAGRTALPPHLYSDGVQVVSAYQRILRELRSQPGVASAALTSKMPLSVSTVGLVLKQSSVSSPLKQDLAVELRVVSDRYLSTLGIPLLAGREFDTRDRAGLAQSILVSSGLARHLWPNASAVGQSMRVPEMQSRADAWQVVGVVADVRDNGPMSPPPAVVYVPFTQLSTNPWHWIEQSLYLVARTHSDAINFAGILKKPLADVDPELPLSDIRTMDERVAEAQSTADFYTLVLSILGACGLLLTIAGVYGVVWYFVNRQRAEIGVRLALGSSRAGVVLLVIGQGMRPVLAGTGLGLAATLLTTRWLASQLYGVSATDPLTLAAVTLTLLLAAAFACYLPARAAAQLDPMQALRSD